jgi:hypothetical protein
VRHHRLPIWRTLAATYRDLGRLSAAMRPVMLSALLILLAAAAVPEFVPERLWDQQLSGTALGLLQDAIEAVLLAPIFIAIHRFIIRDEIARAYTLPVGDRIFWVFVGWLFALKVLLGLPIDFLGVLQLMNVSAVVSSLALVVALIAALAVALRLTILLPALAVGASGATAAHAWADSKGEILRLFAIFFLALAPWGVVSLAGVYLLGRDVTIVGSPPMMLSLLMGGVLQTIILSLSAVIASYAFMVLADHLKRTA